MGRELPRFLDEFDVPTRQAEARRLVHAIALGGDGAAYQNVQLVFPLRAVEACLYRCEISEINGTALIDIRTLTIRGH